ncbi:sensor histidine kinase [Tropicibacter sp. R15_0]|uniref:sensor histidine kinase n=1 Tax=Tropicibacter sp. R15_0 TaxID=2821101 RepID=UPI001ADCB01D|nr:cache domain-containing protein [Tropicibacter sp. R15_0]MBO9467949.1 sensor histidine kinase [Tropicibacter sp. R15_0]
MRVLTYILPILATLAIALVVFRTAFGYFQSEETSKALGRLSLYQSSVSAELNRFSHLPYVLSQDSFVQATALGADTGQLNQRFEDFASQAGLGAIYLMSLDGLAIAASNYRLPSSFVGQSYVFRPYFRSAAKGEQGRFYAIGTTTGQPGYFIAEAVRNPAGNPVGVVAIKIDFSDLEDSWRKSGEQVFLANEDGVVLLASDPDWRYRVLQPLNAAQQQRIKATRQFPGEALAPLDWQLLPDNRAQIGGDHRIHLSLQDLPHGWQLHYFVSDDRAVARTWLVTGLVVFAAGLALIVYQIQRARRVGRALRRSEREEAQLRQSNERLAVEIEERRSAERRLKRTQGELERASRLAALGQLSASVTHELGQPIAAMRNHLVAAEMAGQAPAGLLTRITGMVDRMEGITKQLKFFARSAPEEFGDVNLVAVVKAALTLVEPNRAEIGAQIETDFPDDPVLIRGSQLRLEQVLTNLLRNALDAVEDCDDPWVHVQVGQDASKSWVELCDNGHGLGQATLDELQEPFVTTRESGRGMGLGLAISASILRDHGGVMRASNLPEGGAVFHVRFAVEEA